MKKIILSAALLLGFGTQVAFAEVAATALPTDTRLVTFTFDAHNSYLILSRPKSITDIQFEKDEIVKALALGDTIQWEQAKTGDGQHLFLKPKFENIETSATVITNKRVYQLLLKSTTAAGKWYQRVTWEYPDLTMFDETKIAEKVKDEAEVARNNSNKLSPGTSLDSVNFAYTVEGDAPFKPLTVMDDSKFTYIRMPANIQELPALFLINADNDQELFNYTVKGEYLIVSRLVDRMLLKLGRQEVRIYSAKVAKRSFFDLFKSR